VPQDYAKAREWYEKAAAKDNGEAMVEVGWLHEYGLGVSQDYTKAREWYEKAAAKDNGEAMVEVGWLYEYGLGVPQDYTKAREWYEKAAAKDNGTGKAEVVGFYAAGHGGPRNYPKALELLEKVAAAIEAREIKDASKPGAKTARALGHIAWYALLAGEPARALAAGERALALAPTELWIKSNWAHALMFLGRVAEARELYLGEMDKIDPKLNKPWQRAIAEDFAQFREAGHDHPMMVEIEAAFEAKR
jgi:tetratricopeptide (TPR) repeat protein